VTVARHNYTDYNLSAEYVSRHIIGLVTAVHISDGAWQTKIGYEYDSGAGQLVAAPAGTVQHDAAYTTGLLAGRANLTAVSRYDVTDINNESKKTMTRFGYDTNGSVVFTRDALNRQTNLSYADSFSDGVNRNTSGYPTKITPPVGTGDTAANLASTRQYDYDFGAVTRTQGAVPAGQTQGPIQTTEYDAAGRISRINNLTTNAYRRWVYDPTGYVSIFETVVAGSPEAYTTVVYDGAGRVRATGGDHPGSTGLFRGQFTLYDSMGRTSQQSNPAEMTSAWVPAGDDVSGWVWTQQTYDWKGRPLLTTNADGTTKAATYGGCGCAGGEVVTIRDELSRRQRSRF
jgi:hypothetical protein